MKEFDCSLADAVQFTGVAILVLGFSNFIWYDPLAPEEVGDAYGKQGTDQHFLRAETSLYSLHAYLPCFCDLASCSNKLQQFHGCLRVSDLWTRSFRTKSGS